MESSIEPLPTSISSNTLRCWRLNHLDVEPAGIGGGVMNRAVEIKFSIIVLARELAQPPSDLDVAGAELLRASS
jgi:hypothetical protein